MSRLTPVAFVLATLACAGCQFDGSGVNIPAPSQGPKKGSLAFDDAGLSVPLGDVTDVFVVGDAARDGGGPVDARSARPDVDLGSCESWPAAHFDPCELEAVDPALDLTTPGIYVFETDGPSLSGPEGQTYEVTGWNLEVEGNNACLLNVASLHIADGARLRVTGNRPLVVASWSSIRVEGSIEVNSTEDSTGAGANPSTCAENAAAAGKDHNNGAGGGGGGGYGGLGAPGGTGGQDHKGKGGEGGNAADFPFFVHGGCPGAAGGKGDMTNPQGGAGGGAVQLSAREFIDISGVIHAGGAGGSGGEKDDGGGGGGSGGYIGLDAPHVALQSGSILAANGGGGGQGSDDALGARGEHAHASAEAAAGGTMGDGGHGGAGGSRSAPEGQPGAEDDDGAGGGGGGGVGYVLVPTSGVEAHGLMSPAPTAFERE